MHATAARPSTLLLVLAFVAIYFIWGSTYLAIRYAVEEIPPLLTAGLRHVVAGSVLFAWSRARGQRVTAAHWRASFVVGALFFLVGHGTLHWGEQVVPSGLAALIIATEPIWIALVFATPWLGVPLGAKAVAGLLAGLAGVGILMGTDAAAATPEAFWGSAVILVGAISWAVGVGYSARANLPADAITRAATTLLAGSVLLGAASLLAGEPAGFDPRAVGPRALGGLVYLIVFGSLVTFTAYTWLLEHCSATLVATHTYVNPVVAVFLGWALAGEPLNARLAVAAGLILCAIGLINAGASRRAPRPAPRPAAVAPQAIADADHVKP